MVKFQNPPGAGQGKFPGRRGKNWEIADELRARPNEWALVVEGAKHGSHAGLYTSARIKAYEPKGAFEATSRKREDGNYDIYVRFVGEVAA